MENNELLQLINAFKGYRDLLSPIQENLKEFSDTFVSMRDDIEKLNDAFDDKSKSNLESIYKTMAKQAENASELSSKIEIFNRETSKYNNTLGKINTLFKQFEDKLSNLNELEAKANEQIEKLDQLLEDRRKNYNLKDLERNLDSYNTSVKKISEFVNKDIVDTISASNAKLDTIKSNNSELLENLKMQNTDMTKLIALFESTNSFLNNISEKESVNEAYLFDILDKWAEKRKVKIK